MYMISIPNKKVQSILNKYLKQRNSIKQKLDLLKENPRRNCGAHPLRGNLRGKWACWLGSNIRIMYLIDDTIKKITITAVGTHKIY